jgi:dTDP-4-dehydrorhamnose reductase
MVEEAKKKILITGINGMLAQDLISVLSPDYDLYGLDMAGLNTGDFCFYEADITKIDDLITVFKQINPWLVIHAAAFTNVDLAESEQDKARAVNVQGSENLAKICSQFKAKLVFISTDYVFDGKKKAPYLTTDQTCPVNFYGQTKLAAEKAISSILDEYLIVRTSWLFGVHGKNFVKAIRTKAVKDGKLYVVNDQIGSPTYSVSLAQALALLIKKIFSENNNPENYGIYHVTNSGQCSWYDFAGLILEFSNIKAELEPVGTDFAKRAAKRPEFSVLDKSRFKAVAQTELCSWQDALRQYLKQEENIKIPD